MKQIRLIVNTKTQKYPIIIGNNLISKLSKIIKYNSIEFKQCLLVIDKKIPKKMVDNIKKSLKNKIIAGAGLDMIDGEWMDDKTSHPLIQYSLKNDNLLITPHIGGATSESIYGARIFMASKLYDFVKNF